MLTRVYGTAFLSKEDLEEHLRRLEEARARDHRKLGRGAGPVHALRALARHAVLAAAGHARLERADRPVAHQQRRPRLHRGAHADPLRRRPLEAVGPLARLPRAHVLHGRGGPAHGPQAHELPRPRPDLQARPALLPRSADPPGRAGPGAPPRAQRHPARPAARALDHPGRRARVLHRGADRGGGAALPRLRLLHLRPVRLLAAARALDAAREARRQRRHVGPRRGGAAARAREPRPRVRPERGRRRLLRAEDRPAHDRQRSAAPGSSAPCSSTTTCPSSSSWPTSARTTPSTAR